MPREGSVKFLINIFEGSGEFELCEGGSVAVSGRISIPEDVSKEVLNLPIRQVPSEKDVLSLNVADIYKELRLRGYDYEGIFRGITESDNRGINGQLKWENNWISFIDTMLQFSILGQNTRELYLPTRLQRAVINPKEHLQYIQSLGEGGSKKLYLVNVGSFNDFIFIFSDVPVHMYRDIGVIKSAGIELRGMKASLAPRRQQAQASPKLEKYQFVPCENNQPFCEDLDKSKIHALTAILQIVLENSLGALKLKVTEIGNDRPIESVLAPSITSILEQEPMLSVESTIITSGPVDTSSLEALDIKHAIRDIQAGPVSQDLHLIVGSDLLLYNKKSILDNAVASLKTGGFVLLEEVKGSVDSNKLKSFGLEVISTQVTSTKTYILLRRPISVPSNPTIIHITENNFAWIEPLKDAMKLAESDGRKIYLYVQGEELTGLVGMVNCLKQEPGGSGIRAVFIQDSSAPKFSVNAYEKQLRKDLVHNVLKKNVWGSFRHLLLDQFNDSGKLQVEHAYINTLTRGDLASLRWIEGPLGYYK